MKQRLSFIAHLKSPRAIHIAYREEITQRGFPCIISNDLNKGKEYPNCLQLDATSIATIRESTILDPQNTFFIYFIDDASPDADVELGLALAAKIEHICLIGHKRKSTAQFHPLITHYSDWSNFLSRHFFA